MALVLLSLSMRCPCNSVKVSFAVMLWKFRWLRANRALSRIELVYKLLASMPRAQIARVHRRIAPCVQVDIVGVSISIVLINVV